MRQLEKGSVGLLALLFVWVMSSVAMASNCGVTSTGLTPINDLGAGLYLGQFQGGLYPNGSNQVPAVHASVGNQRAANVQPLDVSGDPDPSGNYVLLSIGMSNATQEFCSPDSNLPCKPWTFMGQAAAHPDVNRTGLAIVNGAIEGQTSADWDAPTDSNYARIRNTKLMPQGLSEAQVQVVWLKTANANPNVSLPSSSSDAFLQVVQLGNIVRALKLRYPNLKSVFFASRAKERHRCSPDLPH